jgi:hypothetical protein
MKQVRRHISYANVAATLALVLALSGGAIAATGGFASGGRLQACVNHEGGLKLLKSGQKCKRGQKLVSWNQTGPAGPKGATGATGSAGAPGAPGAPGTPATTLWAEYTAGGLVASSGVTNVAGNAEARVFTFNRDISRCGVSASLNEGPALVIYVARNEFSNQLVVRTGEEGKPAEFGGVDLVVTC